MRHATNQQKQQQVHKHPLQNMSRKKCNFFFLYSVLIYTQIMWIFAIHILLAYTHTRGTRSIVDRADVCECRSVHIRYNKYIYFERTGATVRLSREC